MKAPEMRRGNSTRSIDILFEDSWTGLAHIGTTSWSFPDGGLGKRYAETSERLLALFLAAPALLEALELVTPTLQVMAERDEPSRIQRTIWQDMYARASAALKLAKENK